MWPGDKWVSVIPSETWKVIMSFLEAACVCHVVAKHMMIARVYVPVVKYIFVSPHRAVPSVSYHAIGKLLPGWFVGRSSNDARCVVCGFDEEEMVTPVGTPETVEGSEDLVDYPEPPGGFEEFLTFRFTNWPFPDKEVLQRTRWSSLQLRRHVQQCWGYVCNICRESINHQQDLRIYRTLGQMSRRNL